MLLERDAENSYLAGDDLEASPMELFFGSSIPNRIAVGPQQGRKVSTLQTLPACDGPLDFWIGKVAGFPCTPMWRRKRIHARGSNGCAGKSAGRRFSKDYLSLTPNGNVRYDVKGFTSVAGVRMRKRDPAENPSP